MKQAFTALLILAIVIPAIANGAEDKAADAIAAAFSQARQAANLPKIEQMGRNTWRGKVCGHDLRMASGSILIARYETSDPGLLPDSAKQIAIRPDGYKITARFGVGVCSVGTGADGKERYSVLIATYESRWNSFLRSFCD